MKFLNFAEQYLRYLKVFLRSSLQQCGRVFANCFFIYGPQRKKDDAYANFSFGGGGVVGGAGPTRFIVGDVQMANFV